MFLGFDKLSRSGPAVLSSFQWRKGIVDIGWFRSDRNRPLAIEGVELCDIAWNWHPARIIHQTLKHGNSQSVQLEGDPELAGS